MFVSDVLLLSKKKLFPGIFTSSKVTARLSGKSVQWQ